MAVVLDQAAAAQVPAAAVRVLVQAQAAAAKARAAAVQAAVVKAHQAHQGRLDLLAAAALATQARLLVQALHRAVLQARVHPRAHLQDKGVVLMMQ